MWPFKSKPKTVAPATPTQKGESLSIHEIIKKFINDKKLDLAFAVNKEDDVKKAAISKCVADIRALDLVQNLNKVRYLESLNGNIIGFERDLLQFEQDMNRLGSKEFNARYRELLNKIDYLDACLFRGVLERLTY